MERTDFEQWTSREVARLLELVETERRYYQEIVASLPVGLVVLSADRSIVRSNRAFRRTFDVRSEDLRGKTIEQIIPSPHLVERIRNIHVAGAHLRRAPEQPDLYLTIDDRPLRVALLPIRRWDSEDELETLLMVEDLRTIGNRLASMGFSTGFSASPMSSGPRVSEPESQALRKQLDHQVLTRQRHDALHSLSGRLAHDLNNPLMIITGYSEEMLETLSAQDPMRDDVQQVLDAAERISGITAHLLAFARRPANRPRQVELGRLLRSMEERIAKAAGGDVAVELIASGEPVWASADPAQFEEIILALVSGAREDAQERSRVTIGWQIDAISEQVAEATLKPGKYARVTIHDNGRGVDAAKRATIFESVLAGKDPEKNAGPGLARAYAIVREWGGDIAFSADPARGSTFKLYLPYAPPGGIPGESADSPQAVEGAAVEPGEARAAAAAPSDATRATILLVEDEAGIRALVRKILRRERYHVLEASSGEEALSVALSHQDPIHLLLTDVMLPGISGRELAEWLHKRMPRIRVVYVSGYTGDEGVRTGEFPPGSRFLQKPFTLSALVSKVRESLDAR